MLPPCAAFVHVVFQFHRVRISPGRAFSVSWLERVGDLVRLDLQVQVKGNTLRAGESWTKNDMNLLTRALFNEPYSRCQAEFINMYGCFII